MLPDDLVGALQAGAVGQLGVDDQVALVLLGNEAAGHGLEHADRVSAEQAAVDQQDDHAEREQQRHDAAVAVDGAVEGPVEALEERGEAAVDEPADEPAGDGARRRTRRPRSAHSLPALAA